MFSSLVCLMIKITVENFKIIVKYKQVKLTNYSKTWILSLYYYSSLSLSQESYTVCTDLYHHFLILILFCKHFPEQLNFFQNILRATIYFIVWIYHNVVNHSSFRYLMAVSIFCFDKQHCNQQLCWHLIIFLEQILEVKLT